MSLLIRLSAFDSDSFLEFDLASFAADEVVSVICNIEVGDGFKKWEKRQLIEAFTALTS